MYVTSGAGHKAIPNNVPGYNRRIQWIKINKKLSSVTHRAFYKIRLYLMLKRSKCKCIYQTTKKKVTENNKIEILLTDQYPGFSSTEFKDLLKN